MKERFIAVQLLRCGSGQLLVPVSLKSFCHEGYSIFCPRRHWSAGHEQQLRKRTGYSQHPLATGRLVRVETAVDDRGQSPRPRWEVEVAPLSFPGRTAAGVFGMEFQQVKVFDLPDTAVYQAGRSIRFRYQLVPQAQHTPWRTPYERYNTAQALAWGDRLPELTLSEVELVPLQ